MKKVLLLTALVLGAASCQKDFTADVESRGEVDVQLSVAAPELIGATRTDDDTQNTLNSAYGAIDYLDGAPVGDYRVDWNDVDLRYSLEVYDVNNLGAPILDAPIKDRMVIIKDKYEPVKFDLRLIPNRDYQFVIFADFVPQGTAASAVDYANQSELGLRHTIGDNLTQITIKQRDDQNKLIDALNDELADSYFKTFTYKPTNNTTNNINDTEDVILQRPYAKVRVIATDLAELNLNVEPKYVAINYNNTPILTAFNAVTGEISVDKNYDDKAFEFEYVDDIRTNRVNHVYNDDYDAKEDTADNGTKRASHLTLFTDYILATADQSPISFTMTVFDEAKKPIKTVDFNTNIPVQRNHLTTIIGNVLTAATDVTVTIDDNFANAGTPEERPFYQVAVFSGYEFVKAFYEGREIILMGHITVTEDDVNAYMATRAAEDINPIVNLNGFTLTFVNDGNKPLLTVEDGCSLTIVDEKGTGAVVLQGDGVAIQNNGELNVVDTTVEAQGEGSVFENNGEANIEGSTLNEGALENNGEANIADSTLNAGSVENNGTANLNGGDVDDDAVENGESATVGTYVYDAKELQDAINTAEVTDATNEIRLAADIKGDVTILQKNGVNLVINGCGYEFDGVITVNGGARSAGKETLTFTAINFATEGSDFTFISAPSKINDAYNYSHNVTIENCTFEGDQTVGSASFTGTYNFVMKECKATNMHSILQLQSVDNTALVEYIETVNCKNGLSFGNTAYPTLKNSTIKASEYGVRADGDASRGALLLEGNTIEANVPVIVRKATSKYDVTLANNNITKGGLFEVVFTNGKDDEAYVAPTGTYTITGAEDYMVYPRNAVANWAEFAATTASKVVLLNDITGDANYQLKKNIVVDLNGKSMTLPMINIHSTATLKNGTINGKMYARTGCKATLEGLTFSGTISDDLSTEGHLQVQGGCDVYAKNCTFAATTVNGSQTRSLSIEGSSSGTRKFEGCDFKFLSWGTGAGKYKKNVYINTMNGTTTVDFINCKLNGKAPNIIFAAAYPLTNLTMSGCDNTAPTLEINRAKDTVTEVEWAHISSLIANNKFTQVRLFYADGSNEYIK